MKRNQVLKLASHCTVDELEAWVFRLEQEERDLGRQSITNVAAVDRYREIRKRLVVLRIELIESGH